MTPELRAEKLKLSHYRGSLLALRAFDHDQEMKTIK
jgi:hypothetical protein